jgi:RNA polymerase sigma-70 factor (ECF subfamily)
MEDHLSAELMARWQGGDQQAAEALFQRYAERLLAVVRTRLSAQLARRFDPEDVVQSAYRSFFAGARDGRYVLAHSGDLWRLLVAITLHKLRRQVQHHQARKRNPDRENDPRLSSGPLAFEAATLAREPSPVEAAALADELEQLMQGLDLSRRRILELRLQGYTLEEIAADTQQSLRTVRRRLDQVKQYLEQRCQEQADS